ncbi:MAG: DEAD/DEAH box helicase [Cyanobacteria bacterium MAG CAR1_bin_15]|nr:DEAD/DEAH box helicase [Cyanobacteria bacterium MAG CAR1_bin_15]
MHDPIGAFSRIRAFYLSYLDTASRLEPAEIRAERRSLLMETGTLCTSPLLEPLPSWETDGRSFEDLVTEEGEDAVLAGLSLKARRAFVDLIGCGLMDRDERGDLYRPYSHQVTMLKRGVRDGHAGIVTSGTGSGKTEAFLLPILASIVEEATRDQGGWPRPESGYLSSENRWWRGKDGQPMAKGNPKGEYKLKEGIQNGLQWNDYKDHEQRQGEQRPAAIRALILYPMNALVEDQMTRLRMALDSQDARDTLDHHLNGNRVFFGRYTGKTKGGPAYLLEHEKALRNLRHGEGAERLRDKIKGCDDNRTLSKWKNSVANSRKNRIENVIIELSRLDDLESAIRREANISSDQQFAFPALDGAEMVTRWDMQGSPPDILVTNISMLNAMLSRKTEACMLEKTREWLESDPRNRFTLVIDELHLQRGSAGTEFMYLLRLLFVRLGLDQPERHHQLRLLASSASLPVDEEDARGKEASLNYLYDAFADFGLGRGSGREDWIEAIVPGKDKYAKDGEHPDLSFDATDLDKAIDVLMKTSWGTGENEDNILPEPGFENHREDLTVFLDALHVPNWNRLEERWEWLASAVGCAFEKACCRNDDSVVATSLDEIFEHCWPNHGWPPLKVERNMRLLTAVVSAADHSGNTGKKLRKLRQEKLWPVPRFRLHTFFRVPQGLFVDVVPPAWRSEKKPQRWQGELSIERTGTTRARNSSISVRQFELLSCECCGECFIGGVRADEKRYPTDNVIAELLPNEEDIESLPDLSISNRFEEYIYNSYVIFWPKDNNKQILKDSENQEKWEPSWIDPRSGIVFKEEDSEKLRQPGYLFQRNRGNHLRKVTDQSPGSHMPCRCPRCKIDYGRKRARQGNRQPSLLQFSPLRSQRSGLERTTQLLASELYGVLAREGDSSRARLVSFSDSRQAAARTALGVEQLHHRDMLREILLRAILAESKRNQSIVQQSQNIVNLLEDEISQKRRSGFSDDSHLVKLLLNELKRIKMPALHQSQGIIPLESILELEPPQQLDVCVKPFLAQLIKLRVHPFCERGITKLKLPSPDNRSFDWWELFTGDSNGNFKWSLQDSNLDDETQYKELCRKFLDKILARIGRIVFDKTYFALEATGLAYPVPRPPEDSLLQGEVSESELSKAAAWMRMYTDNYRFAPFPPEWEMSNRTQKITLEQVERGQSSLAKLIQDSARALDKNPEDLFNNMQQLMNRYGHSTDAHDYIRLEKIAFRVSQDGDACWHCTNCRRVHLHRGLGFCTRCGTKLPDHATGSCAKLQRDNFLGRRLRHSLFQGNSQENPSSGTDAFRLRCEELTGQTIDPASRQREFKGIQLPAERHPLEPQDIEMLSVTTTMEVGIDIGPLEAIVQANMPPQRFNYQQRVGRAGRRGQAFSFVLTLCRSRSHDLHYFRHPEAITGGAPPPPFLVKRLPRIAERLVCKDQLIAAFRLLEQHHRNETGGFWLGDLVKPVDVHGDFIPAAILKNEKLLKEWKQWFYEALQFSDVQIRIRRTLDAIKRGNPSNSDNLLLSRSSNDLWQKIIKHKEAVGGNTVGLAAHLANYGLFPMYGLPTRVRELVLGKSKNSTEPTESLSRDLEVAIYEYAPGNVLIHDKKDHRCIGLTPRIGFSFSGNRGKPEPQTLSDNPWDRRFRLGQCPKCWVWKDVGDKTDEKSMIECPSCQNKSPLRDWHSKWCLEPAAFRTDFKPQTKSVERLPGSSSNSLCADSKPPESDSWKEKCYDDPEKTVRTAKISLTTSDSTIVYRLNQGTGKQGFSLSWQNGVMSKGRSSSNESPLKAQAIDKRILSDVQKLKILNDETSSPKSQEIIEKSIYLAAPRVTDGLYLLPQKMNSNLAISYLGDDEEVPYLEQRNSSKSNSKPLSGKHYWQGIRAAAISASEILISAATRYLDIELRSLQAVEPRLFRHQEKEKLPMLQIVDEHVNGAGFSDWLGHGDLPPILKVLSDILNNQAEEWATENHQSKCQEACYRCLKSYDNQNLHGLLDWRLGLAYLRSFTDSSWQCGLDGDFSWSPLQQWPETALRLREDTLKLWNEDKSDNRKEYPIPNSSDKIYAFRLGSRRPWVIIRHPLWRWGLNEGLLTEFASSLDPEYQTKKNVLCWDTFNLSRRPGRTRQWMGQQQPRRQPRSRRCPREC